MGRKKFVHQFGFNPTLVRLRPPDLPLPVPEQGGFNPTLVRLRRQQVISHQPASRVSIPRWFD